MFFIDTGAFVARDIKNDQHHEEALRTWQMIVDKRIRCVTSNCVLDEMATLPGLKAGYSFGSMT